MMRVFLIPLLLLSALPARADDKLEPKLQALEARIAKLRAESKVVTEARAKLDVRIAALDAQIAAHKKADPTALGATRVANLEAERDKLEAARRALRRDIEKQERGVAAKVKAVEDARQPLDIEGLIQRVQRGDAQARAAVTKLQARLTAALRARPAQQGTSQWIALRGAGGVRVVNRVVVGGRVTPAAPASTPQPAPTPAKKPVPAEVQAKHDEQDLTDQQKRAAELESRIIAMTRKLMDLERRVAELKQKVAKPDAG